MNELIAKLFCYTLQLPIDNDCLPEQSRLQEALRLFGAIVNSKVFIDATMILFMNKTDVFRVWSQG